MIKLPDSNKYAIKLLESDLIVSDLKSLTKVIDQKQD